MFFFDENNFQYILCHHIFFQLTPLKYSWCSANDAPAPDTPLETPRDLPTDRDTCYIYTLQSVQRYLSFSILPIIVYSLVLTFILLYVHIDKIYAPAFRYCKIMELYVRLSSLSLA